MNSITLMGNLTKDPIISKINSNNKEIEVAKYTLAVDRNGGKEVDYIPCSVIDKGAKWAEKYLKKGLKICVIGKLRINTYEKNGITYFNTEVSVSEQFFTGKVSV